jgi:YHS domain-containing protein
MTNRFVIVAILLLCWVLPLSAGEFYEKNGVALKGYDPVAYFQEHKPVPGSARYMTVYQGSQFHFASAANRDRFAAQPQQYAPQYGGFCAFGMAKGYKASIDPAAFTIVGDKLYLNYSPSVRSLWQQDIPGYIVKADKNWPEVRHTTKVAD